MEEQKIILKQPMDEWGVTYHSEIFVENNLFSIGKPLKLILTPPAIVIDPNWNWYLVRVIGERAELWLYGYSWGFAGEGPRGLMKLLNELGENVNINFVANLDTISPEPIEIEL